MVTGLLTAPRSEPHRFRIRSARGATAGHRCSVAGPLPARAAGSRESTRRGSARNRTGGALEPGSRGGPDRTAKESAVSTVRRRTPHATPSAGPVFDCRRGRRPSAAFFALQFMAESDQRTVTRSRDTRPAGKRGDPGPGTRHDTRRRRWERRRARSPDAGGGRRRPAGRRKSSGESDTGREDRDRPGPLRVHDPGNQFRRELPGRREARESPNGRIRGTFGEKHIRIYFRIPYRRHLFGHLPLFTARSGTRPRAFDLPSIRGRKRPDRLKGGSARKMFARRIYARRQWSPEIVGRQRCLYAHRNMCERSRDCAENPARSALDSAPAVKILNE